MTIRITVRTDRHGRIHFKSPDVPGLWLASKNLPALASDLDEATRDLLRLNLGLTPAKIDWQFIPA